MGAEHLYDASLSFLVFHSSLSPLLIVFTSRVSIVFNFVSIIKLFLTHKVYFFFQVSSPPGMRGVSKWLSGTWLPSDLKVQCNSI